MKYKEEVIKERLENYLNENDLSLSQALEDEDLHHKIYNEDYFIIGYYNAQQWLIDEQGNNRTFEVLSYVMEQEKYNFGEVETVFDNAETLVNHYAYWLGYEVISNLPEELASN
jgi:hypothetical protein